MLRGPRGNDVLRGGKGRDDLYGGRDDVRPACEQEGVGDGQPDARTAGPPARL